MIKYAKTKDGRILPVDIATHELTQYICDARYFKTLDKGSYVTIGRKWSNFYGYWVDIIDEKGLHYSIRPDEVKHVTRELPQATIEELCDEFVGVDSNFNHYRMEKIEGKFYTKCDDGTYRQVNFPIYGAIWTEWGLKFVAKMNDKGELELI